MTAEQLHDALGLLPLDLIEEADRSRQNPKKAPIPFRRWGTLAASAVLVLGCGLFALGTGLLPIAGGGRSEGAMDKLSLEECAPEAPAAAAPMEPAMDRECDCAESLLLPDTEPQPDRNLPPVDIAGAEYRFDQLSLSDEAYLITEPAGLEALGLEPDRYNEDWFRESDLLLISLPGVTSPETLELTVSQGVLGYWEICIQGLPQERLDWSEALLIFLPVQKGHIPTDATLALIRPE